MPTIGILAGMGPKSTGPFIDLLIQRFQTLTGWKNDIDFPPIMIYSLPTPFYIDRPLDHPLLEKTLIDGLKRLELTGVNFIAIPCNTAHLYFANLAAAIQVPLLNIIDLTLQAVPSGVKKVTILGTRPTLDSNLFQQGLQKREVPFLFLPEWQDLIDQILLRIKSGELPIALWESLLHSIHLHDVDTLLIVCTDLNILFKKKPPTFHLIDSSLCLADGIVRHWKSLT